MMDTDRSPCCQLHELMLAMEDSDPATSAALAAHLEACPHCQEDDLAVAPLLTAYRQQELAPLADDLEARLLRNLCGSVIVERPAEPTGTSAC